MANGHGCVCCCFKLILLVLLVRSTKKLPSDDESTNTALPEPKITSYRYFSEDVQTCVTIGLTNCRRHVGSLSKVAGYYRARVGRYANSDSAILPLFGGNHQESIGNLTAELATNADDLCNMTNELNAAPEDIRVGHLNICRLRNKRKAWPVDGEKLKSIHARSYVFVSTWKNDHATRLDRSIKVWRQ